MRTVLVIGGGTPVPAPLRTLVTRGSTSLVERRAAEIAGPDGTAAGVPDDVDRIVFWSGSEDADVQRAAERLAKVEARARREILVFVTAEGSGAAPPAGIAPNEQYVWPRDEDRLTMAFLTGA